jgi:hypothetical protein
MTVLDGWEGRTHQAARRFDGRYSRAAGTPQ